ncbi:MMPL family transporter [Micrococcales bacterium 31B]|nr:MMPL family transporter [Micrococcales bacterium 31B]
MANLLYRLGRGAARRRILTIVIWFVVLIGIGAGSFALEAKTTNDVTIPGQESTQAFDLMEQRLGAGSAAGSANVVFELTGEAKVTDPANAAAIASTVAKLGTLPGVANASNPLDPANPTVSADLQAALSTVTYTAPASEITEAQRAALLGAVDAAETATMQVNVTGTASEATVPSMGGAGEIIGVVVALIVLGITYGGMVVAGMNLLTALVGVGVGALGITFVSGLVELNSTTPILALMLGLAVGIDYALFIFTRFRSLLSEGHGVLDAAGRATATAGSAVVTAGLTVVIALAGLSIVGIPFLGEMGIAAAATVVVSVLVAITLVPAVLGLLGKRIMPRRVRKAAKAAAASGITPEAAPVASRRSIYARWIDGVVRRRWLAVAGAVVALGVITVPAASMHTSLVSNPAEGTTQAAAQDAIADHFGAGLNGPLLVLIDGQGADARAADISTQAATLDDVALIAPPTVLPTGTTALLTVIPKSGPTDEATVDLVHALRDTFQTESGPAVYVTGATAISVDVSESLGEAMPKYLALVVGLALVLLIMVFRSLLVPIVGVLGFLLSLGAALGATVAVFQWGWLAGALDITPGPIMSMLPILVIGILFGLAMDYQIFMVSRIYEEHAHGADSRTAVTRGFASAGPVVAAAALIMFSVFAGFVPEGMAVMRMIAFALAIGILFDAFVVRMVLVPALIDIFGRYAWSLPRWLRWLPQLDVEGANLKAATGEAEGAARASDPDAERVTA